MHTFMCTSLLMVVNAAAGHSRRAVQLKNTSCYPGCRTHTRTRSSPHLYGRHMQHMCEEGMLGDKRVTEQQHALFLQASHRFQLLPLLIFSSSEVLCKSVVLSRWSPVTFHGGKTDALKYLVQGHYFKLFISSLKRGAKEKQ